MQQVEEAERKWLGKGGDIFYIGIMVIVIGIAIAFASWLSDAAYLVTSKAPEYFGPFNWLVTSIGIVIFFVGLVILFISIRAPSTKKI